MQKEKNRKRTNSSVEIQWKMKGCNKNEITKTRIKQLLDEKEDNQIWVIRVHGYGSFIFEGTEYGAEEMRRHKATWEHGVGLKRLATEEEIKTKEADDCPNHPNYPHIAQKKTRYSGCGCIRCASKWSSDRGLVP